MYYPPQLTSIRHWGTYTNKIPDQRATLSFKKACKLLKYSDGLCFDCKGTKYSYIDLDTYKTKHITSHRALLNAAAKITYVEVSQSGKGYHIIHKGKPLQSISGEIDCRTNNLLYITGNSHGQPHISKLPKDFKQLYSKLFGKSKPSPKPSPKLSVFKQRDVLSALFAINSGEVSYDEWRDIAAAIKMMVPGDSEYIFWLWSDLNTITRYKGNRAVWWSSIEPIDLTGMLFKLANGTGWRGPKA